MSKGEGIMNWYLSLSVNQRINLKEMTPVITGLPFRFMIELFGLRECMDMIVNKLSREGFDMEQWQKC